VYTKSLEDDIMASPVLSFRVEEVLVEKLDQLSQATDRDRQYHLKRALTRYVETESWHINAIAEGIADADAGKLKDLSAIKAKWVKRAKNCDDGKS
jgi:predicted transcriptional regulator